MLLALALALPTATPHRPGIHRWCPSEYVVARVCGTLAERKLPAEARAGPRGLGRPNCRPACTPPHPVCRPSGGKHTEDRQASSFALRD